MKILLRAVTVLMQTVGCQ